MGRNQIRGFVCVLFLVSAVLGHPVDVEDVEATTMVGELMDTVVIEVEDPTTVTPLDMDDPFQPSDCFLEMAKGPCRSAFDFWAFDSETKTCVPFVYSGCGGNNNRFQDREACQSMCPEKKMEEKPSPTVPILLPGHQKSKSIFTCPKFEGCPSKKCTIVQEQSSKGCKKCQCPNEAPSKKTGSVSGQPDDDESKEKEKAPVGNPSDVCKLLPERGNCRANLARFYYDSVSSTCVEFVFGGCSGNSNNFVSKAKCNAFCKDQ